MKITWLGHATFTFEYPGGDVLLLDPFLEGNPTAPKNYEFKRVDAIAVTHGHTDHTHDVIPIAKKYAPKTVAAIFELASIFEKKGVANVTGFGKGGTLDLGFARLTAVNAFHSSSYGDGENTLYAGEPAGFIVRAEGSPTIYFAGDTCVFGDMALIAELYKPEIAILPIGGHYTMDPHEAAHATRLLNVKRVIPMHYGTFPPLKGTPDHLSRHVQPQGVEVMKLTVGEAITV